LSPWHKCSWHNNDLASIGEYCPDCLSLAYTPPVSQLCIRDTIYINTSTQQHHPHNGVTSILINNNIVSDIMKCSLVDGSDPRNPNVSYMCTSLRSDNITLTAHTTYHGAEWSSPEVDITIVERCTGIWLYAVQLNVFCRLCGSLDLLQYHSVLLLVMDWGLGLWNLFT